jgi:membrane-bound lytic murein transglycosylase D
MHLILFVSAIGGLMNSAVQNRKSNTKFHNFVLYTLLLLSISLLIPSVFPEYIEYFFKNEKPSDYPDYVTSGTYDTDITEITNNPEKSQVSSPGMPLKSAESNLFKVPEGLQSQVDFWTQIYGKYSSEYGILHDSKTVDLIYTVVDFTPITRSNLHPFTKEHRIHFKLETERSKIIKLLKNFDRKTLPKNMTANEQRIWDYFKPIKGKNKFKNAIENLRFQLGQKDFVEKAFFYSGIYLNQMEKIFLKENLPVELTRIPFVESSFNIMARSKVGASGIWQIMPSTGRKLIPNDFVDYRNDPLKATELAAKLLKFNYKVLKVWPLAVTAYNHGPTGIRKLSLLHKTNDLTQLIKASYGTKSFAFASANFYTCFLAILNVEKNMKEYFPDIQKGTPLETTAVTLKKPLKFTQLLKFFNNDVKQLGLYNPHLTPTVKRSLKPIPKGSVIYLPESYESVAASNEINASTWKETILSL